MKSHVTAFLFWLLCQPFLLSQTYYAHTGFVNSGLLEITFNGTDCNANFIGPFLPPFNTIFAADICQCPEGTVYITIGDGFNRNLFQVNSLDARVTPLLHLNSI